MNQCHACRHHAHEKLLRIIDGAPRWSDVALCYHPELLVDGGSSLCRANRAPGGPCAEGQYFEEREG